MDRSLKNAILLPFIVVFFLTFLVIFIIHFLNHENNVRNLSYERMHLIADSVETKLEYFFNEPLHMGMFINNSLINSSDNDIHHIQSNLYSTMKDVYHLLPQIDLVGYGTQSGDFVAVKKSGNGEFNLVLKDKRTDSQLNFYDGNSTYSPIIMSLNTYNNDARPWFLVAKEATKPTWTGVYESVGFYDEDKSTISAVIPNYNNEQVFQGSLSVDIRMETLGDFLRGISKEYNVGIYIFDGEKKIIASSANKGTSDIIHENDFILADSMKHFSKNNMKSFDKFSYYETSINGNEFYNSVMPYINSNNKDFKWYIGVVVSKDVLHNDSLLLAKERIFGFISVLIVLLLGLFVAILRLNKIISPLELITVSADKLANGFWTKKIECKPRHHVKEINSLVDSFNTMSSRLEESFNDLKKQAYYDGITGLVNQYGLIEEYNKLLMTNGTLFIFSIKSFDNIKNSLGYNIGDLLLKKIAARLKYASDEKCLIARIEGGDFALFTKNKFDFEQSRVYAQDIKKELTKELKINNVNIAFRVSVGIVTDIEQYHSMEQSLRNGCLAVTRADKAYSYTFHYESSVLSDAEQKTVMLPSIKKALDNKEFTPFYQPIVELKTGKIVGAEALARWSSAELGYVSPVDFIPVAEESGFIEQVGEAILYQACLDTVRGIEEGKWSSDIKIHVNISVIQVSSAFFIGKLNNIIEQTKVNPKNLSLEITESSLIDNEDIFNRNLSAIIAMGIHVSIDDFGTGYSSLSYLQDLEFHCLKVDRAFINTLDAENYRKSLTAMILNISDSMGKYVVAEGIETKEQVKLLMELNCNLGQGFYFSRPVTYDEWQSKTFDV